MTPNNFTSRMNAGSHRILRALVELAAAAAAIACFATVATLLVEHPEHLFGAPEAVAAAAMAETHPSDGGAAEPEEREIHAVPAEATEGAQAGLMTVAGVLIDSGVEDTGLAAAIAALAAEMASNVL